MAIQNQIIFKIILKNVTVAEQNSPKSGNTSQNLFVMNKAKFHVS